MHRPLGLSLAITAAVWAIAATRWIATESVVPWDSKNQFYAFLRFLAACFSAGDLPFWNPYHYAGHPSIADPQSFIFLPVFVLWAMLDPVPSMRAFDIVVLSHLLAGGAALVISGRRSAWPPSACVLAAVIFMFGGAAAARLQHTGIIVSYGLFPVALLTMSLALERGSKAIAVAFAVIAASIALCRNQVALLLCAVLLASAVAIVLEAPQPARFLRQRWSVLATMALIGAGLIAVPMVLTIQFAALSNRPIETLSEALRGSLHPVNLATLAAADVFGTHHHYWGPSISTLHEVGLTDDSTNYLFIGATSTLILIWLSIMNGGLWGRGRRLISAFLMFSFLFMLGRYTPFYGFLFEHVPGIALFRRPSDASFVFQVAAAILIGHALSDYVRHGVGPPRWLTVCSTMAVVLGISAGAIWFSDRTGHALAAVREIAGSSAIAAGAVVILVIGRHTTRRRWAATIVAILGVAELLWWNPASRLNAEPRALYSVLEKPTGEDAEAIEILEKALAADHRAGSYPRIEVLGMGGPWQNLAIVRGWEAINGYNPLRIGHYDRLVVPGEENWDMSHRQFPPSFDSYNSSLARALGLTYLVLGKPMNKLASTPDSETEILKAGPNIWIYRLTGALPRAKLVEEQTVDDETGIQVLSVRPGRVTLRVHSRAGGLLVLHDPFYPGWVIEGDYPASIKPAEELFRSVSVGPGEHTLNFRFVPFSWFNLRAALRTILPIIAR